LITTPLGLLLLFSYLIHTLFLASIRTKNEMTQTTDSPTRSHESQELPEQLSQEQFDDEVEDELALLLSQGKGGVEAEVVGGAEGGAEGRGGEADEGEGEEDDDESSSSGYESPKDPHPQPPRHRPMEDELDLDFDPTSEEVWMEPL
jgi:hypothetical protein